MDLETRYGALAAEIGNGIATPAQVEDRFLRFDVLEDEILKSFLDRDHDELTGFVAAAGTYLSMQAMLAGVFDERFAHLTDSAQHYAALFSDSLAAMIIDINLGRIDLYHAAAAGTQKDVQHEINHFRQSFWHLESAAEIFGHHAQDGYVDLPYPVPIAGAPQEFADSNGSYTMSRIHFPYRAYATAAHELSIRLQRAGEKREAKEMSEKALDIVDEGLKFMRSKGHTKSIAYLNLRLFELAILGEGKKSIRRVRQAFFAIPDLRERIAAASLSPAKRLEWDLATRAPEILLAERLNYPSKGEIRVGHEPEMMTLARDWAFTIGKVPIELELNGTYRQALGPSFLAFQLMARYGVELAQTPPERALPHHLRHLRPTGP